MKPENVLAKMANTALVIWAAVIVAAFVFMAAILASCITNIPPKHIDVACNSLDCHAVDIEAQSYSEFRLFCEESLSGWVPRTELNEGQVCVHFVNNPDIRTAMFYEYCKDIGGTIMVTITTGRSRCITSLSD